MDEISPLRPPVTVRDLMIIDVPGATNEQNICRAVSHPNRQRDKQIGKLDR
jgi:hypothetical protein